MSLVDEIQALAHHGRESRCTVCNWYKALTPPEREAFNQYIDLIREGRGPYYYNELRKVCANHGLEISDTSFREHCREHHDKLAAS